MQARLVMAFRVFLNGYGTIGRRVAYALANDREIEFIGIGKYSIDDRAKEAREQGFKIFVPEAKMDEFKSKGYEVEGSIKDAIVASDLIVDASKDGLGYENKINYYLPLNKPAIFQGGEDRYGEHSVADIIHNSRVNYEQVYGKRYVIQGSCNVTGLGRIMQPLIERYGDEITRFDATLIRRWADLEDKKEVKDSIEWDRDPHHQKDVADFIKSHALYVDVYKVPSRMMHLHQLYVRFKHECPSKDSILDVFEKEWGVALLSNAKGTADVRKKALELGFPFGDTCMVHIHTDVLKVQGDMLKITYSDDQTGIVAPENHMLMQAMLFRRSKRESLERTERIFRLNERKKALASEFG
ncbi:MAG: type II glyceraldehyde-3-phosphate dehydrogenase [Candidatus Nitrosocaldus sp.]